MGDSEKYAEKERLSGDIARSAPGSPMLPVLPTVNPEVEKQQQPSAKLHPAFYVITWITLSSSIILFNKWILDTAKFRESHLRKLCHWTALTLGLQITPLPSHAGILPLPRS